MRCHPKSDRRLVITSSNRGISVEHASALPAARSRCLVWPVLPAGSRRWGSRKSLRRRVPPGRGSLRYNAPEPMGVRRGRCHVDTPRTKRQYVWEKTGGFCWYCGARLYLREDADTELKRRLAFTVDHLHPRVHGGRGRANKVPACKYCNTANGICFAYCCMHGPFRDGCSKSGNRPASTQKTISEKRHERHDRDRHQPVTNAKLGPEPGRVSMKNWCRRQQATTEEQHD